MQTLSDKLSEHVPHPNTEDGKEVFASDEIPFEVALEVVKREMEKHAVNIGGSLTEAQFGVEIRQAGPTPYFRIYTLTDGFGEKEPTLGEALKSIKTPEQRRAEKIAKLRKQEAELRAELAELERA